jgi:hypothetical protein
MSSGYETIMAAVLSRLQAAPTNWGALGVKDVRRAHLTMVPRSGVPAVHLVEGTDEPRRKEASRCIQRDMAFSLALFVRSDEGPAAADALKLEAYRRVSPDTTAYAAGIVVKPGRISVNPELADADSIRIDMEFTASYPATEWTLEAST